MLFSFRVQPPCSFPLASKRWVFGTSKKYCCRSVRAVDEYQWLLLYLFNLRFKKKKKIKKKKEEIVESLYLSRLLRRLDMYALSDNA